MPRMELSSKAASPEDVLPWRDIYRLEMGCQIIHDSIHSRPGWTNEYFLFAGGTTVGYGSVAVAGPAVSRIPRSETDGRDNWRSTSRRIHQCDRAVPRTRQVLAARTGRFRSMEIGRAH